MSILSVDQISPIGSGTTITLTSTETKTGNIITVGTGASVFSPAGNTLALGTNNTERLRITNAGKIGIGTNNPTQLIEVQDRSTGTLCGLNVGTQYGNAHFGGYNNYPAIMNSGNQPLIYCDTNNDRTVLFGDTVGFGTTCAFRVNNAERARIDSGGRLLVGTNTSRGVGDVTAKIQLEGNGFAASSLSLISNAGASAGNTPHLTLGKSRGSSTGSNTIVASGDALGQIQFAGADGTDCNTVAASIIGRVDGTPGSNDMPGRLVFSTTADGAAAPSERMKIDSAGNVTITDGDLVIGTSGHGIDFSATADGTGSSQNEIFDDYEEGSWTPVIEGLSNTPSFHNLGGHYTKIGNRVFLQGHIQVNVKPQFSNQSAAFTLSGLPFTANVSGAGGGYYAAHGVAVWQQLQWVGASYSSYGASNDTQLSPGIVQSGTRITFQTCGQDIYYIGQMLNRAVHDNYAFNLEWDMQYRTAT